MSLLKRRVVDVSAEEDMLTGMIVSDTFCRDVAKLVSPYTIETPYIARIIKWCQEYYYKHKEAPGMLIQNIFNAEKDKIDPAEQEAISGILVKLSEQYATSEINVDYFKDRAMELIRSRAQKYAATQILSLNEIGKTKEAEIIFKEYHTISIETSGWEDPFNPAVIRNHFVDEQLRKSYLFQLKGEVGKFIGPFERNWLVAFMAPVKRGKTFWLIELALQAVFMGRRVIFISLEMNLERVRRRFYKRLTSMVNETLDYIFPVFDCLKNQDNTCNKKERAIDMRLLDSEGKKPIYTRELKYKACEACRGTKDFIPATWFTTNKVEKMKTQKAIKLLDAQAKHFGYNTNFGSNIRTLAYPAFSANLSRVKRDIMNLVESGHFIPDVIVIDYADILAPEDSRIIGRERIDQTWKSLKGISDEMHCMVATASQSNRGSFEKKNVVQTDASEDIRKLANSDLFLAINQTPQEKKDSITRISRIACRDENFDQYEGAIVLQQLALGQICLDSYMDRPTTVSQISYEDFFV
jgi:hypothetical protein